MHLGWFANVLVHHPFIIISAVAVFSGTCIIIPFTLKTRTFPNFQDPQMGFITRGTDVADRLSTWYNLIKATKPSGEFIVNPREYTKNQIPIPTKQSLPKQKKFGKKSKHKKKKNKPVYGSISMVASNNYSDTDVEVDRWKAVENLTHGLSKAFVPRTEEFFCGNPDERYAHLIIQSENKDNLFTLANMLAMCKMETDLYKLTHYEELCIQNTNKNDRCCRPWSLPNYVAILNDKNSCDEIEAEDIEKTKKILMKCAKYYHNMELGSLCLKPSPQCGVPLECIRHDAVLNIMDYLTPITFLPPNHTEEWTEIKEVAIFLPLACSTAIVPYYHELEKSDMKFDGLVVVAMDFGIKNALFDQYLVRDTYLMGAGGVFIFLNIWLYTHSFFLTLMTVVVIIFSLGISYFCYVLIFDINFFPFMNLLAAIVSIGIGSDDAFIFCKIWYIQKKNQPRTILQVMNDTFHHAFSSMFVTAITTAVAFLGSYISSVTAVCCFSVFAGTAVVANYILMMTWFPACMVLWERSCFSHDTLLQGCCILCHQRWSCFRPPMMNFTSWFHCSLLSRVWKAKEQWLIDMVIKFRFFWFISLLVLAGISASIVLVYPKLQLPTSPEFQLFARNHPFEQYDLVYKHHFWFTHLEQMEQAKLPMRFVWGVLPVDNGNHLDPTDKGSLILDPTFDITLPESQKWLVQFCQNLRLQPFYHSMMGPLLPNCFVETFMNSMERKCYDPFLDKDRRPCCNISEFPFTKDVFNACVIDEVADIYETPADFLNAGMAGPKFSKDQNPTIKAIIVEYDSIYNYSMAYDKMDEFYTTVESYLQKELESAPDAMKNGWFISDLQFYDLQRELSESTKLTILISMSLALAVLFMSTLNLLTSLFAIITITSSIFVTMAVLVLLGWRLNILESTAISTAIGLTVDFSLHYAVNYRLCPEEIAVNREAATRYALSHMAGPSLMAAITTGAAGAFMMPSMILPYIQIGIFLVLVMFVSWVYATFLLCSMFAIMGPIQDCGQFDYKKIVCCFGKPQRVQERSQQRPSNIQDCHELETLTAFGKRDRPTPKPLRRSLSSGGVRFTPSKYVLTDQSPSATSAITIIMADDN